jgi:hypothetical protein
LGFFTRKLMTLAPIAIGGLVAILYFKKAFSSSPSEAGHEIGSSASSLGGGLGSGLGSIGTGVSTFGQGLGTGISGLLNPIYTLIDISNRLGFGSSTTTSTTSKAETRVSGKSRTSSGGGSSSAITSTGYTGYTGTQQGSYANKEGGVSYY